MNELEKWLEQKDIEKLTFDVFPACPVCCREIAIIDFKMHIIAGYCKSCKIDVVIDVYDLRKFRLRIEELRRQQNDW